MAHETSRRPRISTLVPARLCLLAISLAASSAFADGVCEKGFRDTTESERATMTRVLEAIKAALPQPPEGWVIGGYEDIDVVGNICMDAEATPWAYDYTRIYNRVDDAEQRD